MNGKETRLAEDMMKKLGLLPWELWEAKAIVFNLENFAPQWGDPWDNRVKRDLTTRGTGRTHKILIGCLVEMAKGRQVYFSAKNWDWEKDCVCQVKDWASKLGIDTELIRPHQRGNQNTRPKGAKLYIDHYV